MKLTHKCTAMAKIRYKISAERMIELQKLAKLLPGLQMVDNKGVPVFNIDFKDVKYADLSPADKKKYTNNRRGPFKRIEKQPRYINHLEELIRIYKKEGAAGVESYASWCNEITNKSNAAGALMRPYNRLKTETAAAEAEVLNAKFDLMIAEANG